MRWFYRAIGGGAWPVMRSHVSWCTKAMRVSLLRQKQYYVVWDDGEPKCEIMVASSVWEGVALWFVVSLLITTTGPVRVGCVPPAVLHCYLVLDTSTRLLYVPHVGKRKYIIHESERRRRSTRHGLGFFCFVFPFDKSQFYYTSSSTITCWISRCVRSPDASSVKRKLTNACTSSWKFSGHSCIRSN